MPTPTKTQKAEALKKIQSALRKIDAVKSMGIFLPYKLECAIQNLISVIFQIDKL